MKRAPYLLLTFFLLGTVTVAAQTPAQKPAAYEADMIRLSEILGSLHYLRPLCGGSEQGQWRVEMQTLIDAASLPPEKRALLVAGFNRGYTSNEKTYPTCTEGARAVVQRFLDEGGRLSREIATRYGN